MSQNGLSFYTSILGAQAYGQRFNSHSRNLAATNAVAGRQEETFITQFVSTTGIAGVETSNVRHLNQSGVPIPSSTATYFAVGGDGYIPVQESATERGNFGWTRDGTFELDGDMNMVNSHGQFLQVFLTDTFGVPLKADIGSTAQLETLNVKNLSISASATDSIDMAIALIGSAETGSSFNAPVAVYDSVGQIHSIIATWTKSAAAPAAGGTQVWTVSFTEPEGAGTFGAPYDTGTGGLLVEFDGHGRPVGYYSPGVLPTILTSPPALAIYWNTSAAASSIALNLGDVGTSKGMVATGPAFQPKRIIPNGYTSGDFLSMAFDKNGYGIVSYTNDQQLPYCRVPLAVFNNPDGLKETTAGVFHPTKQSGPYTLDFPGQVRAGFLSPSAYEGSSVDGTTVYLNMIEDQNNYVGNLKAIETINKMKDRLMQI